MERETERERFVRYLKFKFSLVSCILGQHWGRDKSRSGSVMTIIGKSSVNCGK